MDAFSGKDYPGECLQRESVGQGQSLGTPSPPGQEEDEVGRAGGGAAPRWRKLRERPAGGQEEESSKEGTDHESH